jgi:hypothetical protein
MALSLTSNRLGFSPNIPVQNVYAMIPKESVSFLPADNTWQFQVRYYYSVTTRNLEKVLNYFRSLGTTKPEGWTDARFAACVSARALVVTPVLVINTHTAISITDPTDIDGAVTAIYAWVKSESEPTAIDYTNDETLDSLVQAYLISNNL